MKSTGVIRRIDELGRIVIPKEIRKNLGIREGESLEIYTEEDKIILQKQMVISKVNNLVKTLVTIVNSIYNIDILITDRERIIVSNVGFIDELLPSKLIDFMDKRENYLSDVEEEIKLLFSSLTGYFYMSSIIIDGDVGGLIIIKKADKIEQEEINITKLIKEIIGKQLSIS